MIRQGHGTSEWMGRGDVCLTFIHQGKEIGALLRDVIYAPAFEKNLISVSKLELQGLSTNIHKGTLTVYRDQIANSIVSTEGVGGLYPIRTKCLLYYPNEVKQLLQQGAHVMAQESQSHSESQSDHTKLWHRRFAHLNVQGIMELKHNSAVYGLEKATINPHLDCTDCALGKAKNSPSTALEKIGSTAPLQLLHMDLWGPCRTVSAGGARYLLTVTDDYSRYATIYPLKTKDQAIDAFRVYVNQWENQLNSTVRRIRTDNGLEFCNSTFAAYAQEKGIIHERTNTYSPKMNGVAERLNRTMLEGARTLLIDSGLPKFLWGEMCNSFIYIKNRFPQRKLGKKTPFEMFTGKKPSVNHFKIIGSKCVVLAGPQQTADKLNPKGWEGSLVGYAIGTIGYRVYNPKDQQVRESRHVQVMESPVSSRSTAQSDTDLKTEETPKEFAEFDFEDVPAAITHFPDPDPTPEPLEEPPEWTRILSRPKGPDQARTVQYVSQDGDIVRNIRAAEEFYRDRGYNFNPDLFNFSVGRDRPSATWTSSQQHPVRILMSDVDPRTFAEAISSPARNEWEAAMSEEIATMKSREVYDVLSVPKETKILGTRWVFKTKRDEDGQIKRHRARLVVQGNRQRFGVDYDKVFSPVVNFVVIRLFLILLAINRGWLDVHLDIKCAYLYGDLHETTYIKPPEGFRQGLAPDVVWRLKKSLYGLHQSGRQWHEKLLAEISNLGFIPIPGFSCAFTRDDNCVLLVYVDDIVAFAESQSVLDALLIDLGNIFEISNLGPIQKLLGVNFERTGDSIVIHQTDYIDNVCKDFNIIPNSLVKVPLHVGETYQKPSSSDEEETEFPYRSLVGSLLFLASRTRPDLLFPTILLSQFNTSHSLKHVKMLKQVLQYACNTRNLGITLSKSPDERLYTYTDASWASDRDDRKSFSGFITFLCGIPLSWGCKKQSSVALSSMEAEFMGIVLCLKDTRWLSGIYRNFTPVTDDSNVPVVFSDSLSAIHFSKNQMETSATKHIDIRFHFVKDWLAKSYFELKSIPGKENIADVFTKPQTAPTLDKFRSILFSKLYSLVK